MSVEIRELRPSDCEMVVALCKQVQGNHVAFEQASDLRQFVRLHPGLSLVAQAECEIVAAVLCGQARNKATIHEFAMAPSHSQTGLVRQIMGKAMMKMLARERHRCQITLSDTVNEQQFWESVRWVTPQDEAHEVRSDASAAYGFFEQGAAPDVDIGNKDLKNDAKDVEGRQRAAGEP